MQKYLLKDQKGKEQKPSQELEASLSNLRQLLQFAQPITKDFLNKVMHQNRLPAIRYQQYKKVVNQFCNQQELLGNPELAELININKSSKQNKIKQNLNEKKSFQSPIQNKKRKLLIRNSILAIVGVLLGILCIIKRQKLKQIVKKILV